MATLVSGPQPIMSLAEAQAHLRVDGSDDDEYIMALIDAVTAVLDGPRGTLGRYFAEQVWSESFSDIGQAITLPIGPVVAVENITYSGGEISNFVLSESNGEWTVTPPNGVVWPDDTGDVVVQFRVGLSPIPPPLKMAAMLHLGTLYENRESVVVGTISSLLPNGYEALLAPYRLWFSQ